MAKSNGLFAGIAIGAALALAASGASAATFLLKDGTPSSGDVLNTTGQLTGGNPNVAANSTGIAFTDTANFVISPGELLTSFDVTNLGTPKVGKTPGVGQISGGTAEIFTSGGVAITESLTPIVVAASGVVSQNTSYSNQFALGPGSYYIQISSTGIDEVAGQGLAKYSVELQGTAVPEPATWAAMLLGFGAIGASMRVRRRVIA